MQPSKTAYEGIIVVPALAFLILTYLHAYKQRLYAASWCSKCSKYGYAFCLQMPTANTKTSVAGCPHSSLSGLRTEKLLAAPLKHASHVNSWVYKDPLVTTQTSCQILGIEGLGRSWLQI